MKFTYFLILIGTVLVPFIFSFHPRLRFNRRFKDYFAANLISAFIFIVWDIIFTLQGVWGFSDKYTIGVRFFGLPVEEMLFFICIPFACVFTYHCLGIFYKLRWKPIVLDIFVLSLSLCLLVIGIIYYDRSYTSVTFISTALFLLTLKFYYKAGWLDKIFSVYPVLLIPFFVVNGILTGTGLESPVVWYNNNENMGIRLGTIPVEDIFYGFELIILTLFIYEFFNTRFSAK